MSTLSNRGQSHVAPPSSYQIRSSAAWHNRYNARTNPSGHIILDVAENHLSLSKVAEALSTAPPVPCNSLDYGSSKSINLSLARFLSDHVTHTKVNPDHIAVFNGAKPVLNILATVLCDPGDAALTTGPGYNGIKVYVEGRTGTRLIVASLDDQGGEDAPVMTVAALERAWQEAGAASSRIRFVIICSPNNPTGEVFSRELVQDIVRWGRERGLHLVFDEVYACSVHSDDVEFISVAKALEGVLGDDVHVVWSFSKDLCLSGIRVALLYTQNTQLMQSVSGLLGALASSSRHTHWAVEHLLSNREWLTDYFASNRLRLKEAYDHLTSILERLDIPYMPAQAGFFIWVDLRKWMDGDTVEDEMVLWEELCDARVVLLPGSKSLAKRYGFFRVCFTVDQDTLELAWKRMTSDVLIT